MNHSLSGAGQQRSGHGDPRATATAPTIARDDPRYDLMTSGENFRFVAQPEYFQLIHTPEQVERAVGAAVAAGKRITVRGGGHCGEAFVSEPAPDVVLDLSPMCGIHFDESREAFVIEAGATLRQVYQVLFQNWGVTIPGGACIGVGVGGHISGGGFGPLSRLHGLTVDHLLAVEVVVVDADGTASTVVATRDPEDPNHDLWWAHTGGGGGNFGVVTRYWMRSPGATGSDPAQLLPRPPRALHLAVVTWPWAQMNQPKFVRLVGNFIDWHMTNSDVDTPYAGLYAYFECVHQDTGPAKMVVQMVDDGPDSKRVLDDFLAEINDGVGIEPDATRLTLPFLAAAWYVTPPETGAGGMAVRRKVKSADLLGAHSEEQLKTIYRHLTETSFTGIAFLEYMGYGGKINEVASDATARVHRSTRLKTFYNAQWGDPADDEHNLRWLQEMYRDIHIETGGAPVPNEVNAGAYINYPDIDLTDPEWNTSGVPWHEFYYGANYPRLQRIKATWDPRNVFHHAMSIRPS